MKGVPSAGSAAFSTLLHCDRRRAEALQRRTSLVLVMRTQVQPVSLQTR
jgi:hypothetical protein